MGRGSDDGAEGLRVFSRSGSDRSQKTAVGEARRSELIAVAARHFRHKGFDATTMRDIASDSGMQSGSPFYYFKSKNELLFSVMEEGMLAALRGQLAVLEGLPDQATAWQCLRALALHHLRVLLTPGHDFIAVMLYEQRALSTEERQAIRQLKDEYELAWREQLSLLDDQGRLRAPASQTRLMFFGSMHGTLSWYDPKQKLSLEAFADQLMAVFVKQPVA